MGQDGIPISLTIFIALVALGAMIAVGMIVMALFSATGA
jgi:hypothetical protein